jgi:hypothetical protein
LPFRYQFRYISLLIGGLACVILTLVLQSGAYTSRVLATPLVTGRPAGKDTTQYMPFTASAPAGPMGAVPLNDAFARLDPCPMSVTIGTKFTIDIRINSGTHTVVGQQSYLTFTNSLLQVVDPNQSGCVAVSTVQPDTSSFEAPLQNTVNNATGEIAYASGTFGAGVPPGTDFRVARVTFCAITTGTATLHWQFQAPSRISKITDLSSNQVQNPALYTDCTFTAGNVATATRTATSTSVPTNTPTNTPIPTATKTNTTVPTATQTNTATFTATQTNTSVPTSTQTNTAIPTSTRTNTALPTATSTNTIMPTSTHTNTTVPTATQTNTVAVTSTSTNTALPTNTAMNTTVPTNTRTNTVVPTNTPTSTTVSTSTQTNTAVPTSTGTSTPTPTSTATSTTAPTNTRTSTTTPTSTQTNTSVPTSTRTNTPEPTSTSTATNTGMPTSTRTNTPAVTNTATATNTPIVPTATHTPVPATLTQTVLPPTDTSTSTPQATATPCLVNFTDVPPDSTFYQYIRCLACRGIISGYSDGTFRPGNNITRGQITKMVSNAAGFNEDPGAQLYEDVNPSNTFYIWINRLSRRGYMGGYPCGNVPEEPCIGPDNRPYFRPFANATRGQLAKIVSNAAGIGGIPTGLFYTDVPEENPFYVWIMRLTELGVMSGYLCGGAGEPCDDQQRPYFRPFNNVTRGQASKIVANTFFPGCSTPTK